MAEEVTHVSDPLTRNRIRCGEAAIKRMGSAAAAVANSMMQEALESDNFGRDIAIAKYMEAETDLERALDLVKEARISKAKEVEEK